MSGQGAGYGQAYPENSNRQFNATHFLIDQVMALLRTSTPVQVGAVTVTEPGTVGAAGFVDVTPLINMVDGLGNSSEHGTVYHLPYYRLQGGSNAIIIDPEVGDIGLALIADRDISAFKNSRARSNPGSWRRHDLADGVYFGSILNQTPTQYIRFFSGGMEWKDANANIIRSDADGVKINGVLFDRTQHISNAEEVTSQSGVTLTQHTHPDVQSGSDSTGLPTG